MIFPQQETHMIRLEWQGNKNHTKTRSPRIIQIPHIDKENPWGFFDGAWKGDLGLCGIEAILYFDTCLVCCYGPMKEIVDVFDLDLFWDKKKYI